MTSSLGIPCGVRNCVTAKHGTFQNRCGLAVVSSPCSVAITGYSRSTVRKGRICAVSVAASTAAGVLENTKNYRSGGANDAIEAMERLDVWMRESVVEIVKNLKEAPLLVQVYTKNKNVEGETSTSVTTEKKVVVEDWTAVKERWETGETPLPEGVIFVEEIGSDESPENGSDEVREERTTRVWGIVVQGKGFRCDPICYLLKTCRVGSGPGMGMGLCSTHFCLVRVKSFKETVQSQLKNCWLLQ
ncbi:hypothetical protein TanjilG_09562 [Lupinus angustifolius]|uniref:DUF7804 domain-containing protein n=1 Tax=Lupinus angustifolius TaxID=3871 RepID=A0A1J7GCK6_LUPAN|nr:PREDICTED: uncharacterized protein LOC109327230 [Lupinus angustifolius]OIV98069.1 hypothetical protein TanjilG_09562 [Lupinus angustifolius]